MFTVFDSQLFEQVIPACDVDQWLVPCNISCHLYSYNNNIPG